MQSLTSLNNVSPDRIFKEVFFSCANHFFFFLVIIMLEMFYCQNCKLYYY